jgi:membrane protein required for colicin V production
MTILDIVIIAVLLIGFILGYKDGFIRKLIGLIGLAIAIFLAVYFAASVGRLIESFIGIEFYLSEIIGGVAIFLVTMIIISIIKRVVHPFDKVNNLLNQILGGAVGFIQVAFFLSAVFIILKIFDLPDDKAIKSSLIYTPVYSVIPFTIDYLQDYTPDSKKLIKNYIIEKDSTR